MTTRFPPERSPIAAPNTTQARTARPVDADNGPGTGPGIGSLGRTLLQSRRRIRRATAIAALPVAAAVAIAVFGLPRLSRESQRTACKPHRDRIAVASENGVATRVGMEALRSGANAVDAAISVALTLGVVQPESSGIGGGGFALVWDAESRKVTALDFREMAPAGVDAGALDDRPKEPRPENRGRMIGVPGEVAGLLELHRRFGRRTFAENAAPAIALAEGGYYASRHLAQLAVAFHKELNWSPELHALFKPANWAVGTGGRVVNPALGGTLRRIAAEGRPAFYDGKVAAEIARAARTTGGTVTEQDLKEYRVIEREPLKVRWEGRVVYTMPPPSAGGLLLAETLGMFSKEDLQRVGLNTGAYVHLLAETFRGAIADRMRWLGDPGYVKNNISALMERVRLLDRRGHIALDKARPVPRFLLEEHGTTHLIVVDERGNVVALTSTVNDGFGSFVSTETTGVLLNDELADFTPSNVDKMFSADGDGPNRPRPHARPTSSMTPTLVLRDGQPEVVLGGSGGLRIATGVTQAFLAHTVFGLPASQCVSIPRFDTPTDSGGSEGPALELDESAPDPLTQDLRSRGEFVRRVPNYSAVQMVTFAHGADGSVRISAAADPRKGGDALSE